MTINIAQQIRDVRAALGLTQARLADAAGLTRQQVADWETSRSRPLAEDYLKIMALVPNTVLILRDQLASSDQEGQVCCKATKRAGRG